jgi:hypothetical protein
VNSIETDLRLHLTQRASLEERMDGLAKRYAEFQSEPGLVDTSYPLCKCGNLRHPLSENDFCADCEVAAWQEELHDRWLYGPPDFPALVEAETELRVWQQHAKEMP